jgi:hypothetical protein
VVKFAEGGPRAWGNLASDPGLVQWVQAHIASLGLVGYEKQGLLVYCAYSSRKLARPLSVVLKGESNSGKDKVQRTPALLMPPGDVKDYMDMTKMSLYYASEDEDPTTMLAHKIVLGGERHHDETPEQRDRTRAIRQILSSGYLTKRTVSEGKAREIRIHGPISYSETTTKDHIFNEDANRVFQINLKMDYDQRRNVFRRMSDECAPGMKQLEDERDKIKDLHHEFQTNLEELGVVVPYGRVLAEHMPVGQPQSVRLFQHVLALIQVVAHLHQFQRRRDNKDGCVEATLADYHIARDLALGPLEAALHVSADFAAYQDRFDKLPEVETFATPHAEWRWFGEGHERRADTIDILKALVGLGVLECVEKGAGRRPAKWRKTGRTVDELILPGVATVKAAWERQGGGDSATG